MNLDLLHEQDADDFDKRLKRNRREADKLRTKHQRTREQKAKAAEKQARDPHRRIGQLRTDESQWLASGGVSWVRIARAVPSS